MCTKGRGQNFAFCAHFSRFCEKCKPEREYLHPFKLTEPERYSTKKKRIKMIDLTRCTKFLCILFDFFLLLVLPNTVQKNSIIYTVRLCFTRSQPISEEEEAGRASGSSCAKY